MNIGVLTAGGDCPGLNAVIRSIVLSAKNAGDHNVYGFLDGFSGLYNPNSIITLEEKDVKNIERIGGTILGSTNKGDFGEIGMLQEPSPQALQTIEKIKQTIQDLNLDGLIVTGGDGSLRIAHWIGQQTNINIIGIPKTIDNDLSNTDITLGFNTATTTATEAISKIQDTARSHHRVMVVEVMGRDSGWIALESGIAGGADIILIPEIPYDLSNLSNYISKKIHNDYKAMVIVCAEGAHPNSQPTQPHQNGINLVKQIQIHTEYDARLSVLGYIQRGGEPSTFDKVLGIRLGQFATELLLNNEHGLFISIQKNKLEKLPIEKASSLTRFVPQDDQLIKTAKSIGIYFGQ